MQTAKTLIRLGGCPGWSESSLGAHSFCWFCLMLRLIYWCISFKNLLDKQSSNWLKKYMWHSKTYKTTHANNQQPDQLRHLSSLISSHYPHQLMRLQRGPCKTPKRALQDSKESPAKLKTGPCTYWENRGTATHGFPSEDWSDCAYNV